MNAGVGINPSHPGFAAPGVDAPGVDTSGVDTSGVGTSGVDTPGVQALPEQAAQQLAGQANTPAAKDPGASQISNQHGAPAIAAVLSHFAPEELVLLLQALKLKTQEGQLRTAKEGLQITQLDLKQLNDNKLGKLQESIDKGQSADAKSKYSNILGWAVKIGAAVGSLVAVIGLIGAAGLTGGAAAPLLALAAIGLVSSTVSLISASVQAAGGPPVDINTGATLACKALLTLVGVPEEKREAASQIMAGSLGVITGAVLLDPQLTGGLASGIVLMSNGNENWAAVAGGAMTAATTIAIAVVMFVANPAGSSAQIKEVLAKVPQVATVMQSALKVFSASGTGLAAIVNIGVGFDEHGAAMAQVDRQKFSALIAKLQALMEKDTEQMTQTVKDIQESMSKVSKIIMQAGESRSQIVANLGHSMA